MRLIGISGSLRRASYNQRLLRAAVAEMPADVEFVLFEELDAVPPYSEDLDRRPEHLTVARLRGAIASADAILIATPEYNASIPGQLKNALDWASRPFPDNVLRDKPVAVVGASPGLRGAVSAQADTRRILAKIGANVVDKQLPVCQVRAAFADDGGLLDPGLRERLAAIMSELIAQASLGTSSHAAVSKR